MESSLWERKLQSTISPFLRSGSIKREREILYVRRRLKTCKPEDREDHGLSLLNLWAEVDAMFLELVSKIACPTEKKEMHTSDIVLKACEDRAAAIARR